MQKTTIISVGRLKEDYFKEASAEYEKRLSKYAELSFFDVTPAALPKDPAKADIEAALQKEGAQLLELIPPGSYTVALDIEGKPLSSDELSIHIEQLKVRGVSHFCFVIGSSHGLAAAVKSKADLRLSLSRMTFPHQLAKVVLLEQLYRAAAIAEGTAYHK